MILKSLMAAGVLAGLAMPALADISFPSSFTTSATNGLPPGGSLFATGTSGNELNAVDGSLTGYQFNVGATYPLQYAIVFNGPVKLGGDLNLLIYGWATTSGGVGTPASTLRSISWVHGSESAVWNTLSIGFVAGDTRKVNGANDLSNYTSVSGGFDRNLVTTLLLTFTVATIGGGERIQFDAVSNPEPGTMALFGLGAMGLGGLAWRRRRARTSQRPA